ncbi:hypothetical protein [Histophilus somni]|nr:hypothetical protein [Histophilus somni]
MIQINSHEDNDLIRLTKENNPMKTMTLIQRKQSLEFDIQRSIRYNSNGW